MKSLNTLPDSIPEEIWNIWWDERTKVGMMNDKHLENALLKLQGLGKEEYDAPDELRRQWLTILVKEKSRRAEMRKATLVKHDPSCDGIIGGVCVCGYSDSRQK